MSSEEEILQKENKEDEETENPENIIDQPPKTVIIENDDDDEEDDDEEDDDDDVITEDENAYDDVDDDDDDDGETENAPEKEHPINNPTIKIPVNSTDSSPVSSPKATRRLVRTQRARGLTVDYTPSSLSSDITITTGLHILSTTNSDDVISADDVSTDDDDDDDIENDPDKKVSIGKNATGITVLSATNAAIGLEKAGNRSSQPPGFIQILKGQQQPQQSQQQPQAIQNSANSQNIKKLSRSERSSWRASVQLSSNVVVTSGLSTMTSSVTPTSSHRSSSSHSSHSKRSSHSKKLKSQSSTPAESEDEGDDSDENALYPFSDEEVNEEAFAHKKEEKRYPHRIAMFDSEDSDSNIKFSRIEVAGNYVGAGMPDSDGGVQAISGGTLPKLFQYATSERYNDKDYLESFLVSHRWFTDDITLLKMLKIRYIVHRIKKSNLNNEDKIVNGINGNQNLSSETDDYSDWNTFKRKKLTPIRFRCVTFLKSWIQLCPDDFKRSDSLTSHTRNFITKTIGSDTPNGQTLERALDKALLASDVGVEFTLPKPPPRLAYENTLSGMNISSFLDIPPEEIARQLAAREWKLWHGIRKNEFLPGAWTCPEKEKKAPHIVKMIRASNERTNWTIWEILSRKELNERGIAINHLISIADYSLKLQNFNAVMEIYAGLQSVAIHRLKNTWDLLTPKSVDILKRMEKLFDPEGNWANFREVLNKTTPPCIPYLGFFLTDLTFIYDGNPSLIMGTELINFAKWRTVAAVLKEIGRFHKCPMNFKKNKMIGNVLAMTKLNFDEDAQWTASVALEDKST